jgi:hypothetical protein
VEVLLRSIKANPRDIQKAIREIEEADLQLCSTGHLEEMLTPIFRGYSVEAPRFEPPLYLYRGRRCSTKPTNLSDLTYPPKEISDFGRANQIGEAVFYSATARSVPFFELQTRPNDYIALSHWKTTKPALLNHIGFSSEPQCFLGSGREIDDIYSFVKTTRSISDINALVHDYLAAKFSAFVPTNQLDYYKLTIAISKKLFRDEIFDGLLYPTIQMKGNADNVVLKSSYVDSCLKFVGVEYIFVKSVEEMKYEVDIIDSATKADENGELMWSGRGLNWVIDKAFGQLQMVSEGGAWVAYDSNGNRVDPT